MPKRIEFVEDAPSYEFGRDSLRFRAVVDGKEVKCRVTGEWLMQVCRSSGMSREAMLTAYAANKAKIQTAARKLIEQLPEGQEVILRTGR